MRKVVIILAIMALAAPVMAQSPHIYGKRLGDTATFSWDHVPLTLSCTDGQKQNFDRGVDGTMRCGAGSYPVSWTGNTVKVSKLNADGTDWVGTFKYNYRAFRLAQAAGGIALAVTGPGSFPFSVPTTGNYIAYGKVAIDNADGGCDSFLTKMDEGSETIWDTPNDPVKVGQFTWDRINARMATDPTSPGVPIVYALAAGQHTLTISERENCTKVAGIVILPEGSPAPNGTDEQFVSGEVAANEIIIPLNTTGDLRFEVQARLNDKLSAWAKSTDPEMASVDGVGKAWVVQVTEVIEPPQPPTVSPVRGLRLQ